MTRIRQFHRLFLITSLLTLILCISGATASLSPVDLARAPRHCAVLPDKKVPPAVIVKGDVLATIVKQKDAGRCTGDAVRLLGQFVEKITGKKLPVVEDGTPVQGPTIQLGQTRMARNVLGEKLRGVDSDGYILLSTPNHLLITGGGDFGTVFGVAGFLQRYAGVRWFSPTPYGEVVPHSANLVLNNVNWIDEPAYRGRSFVGVALWGQGATLVHRDWLLFNRIHPWLQQDNERGRLETRFWAQHGLFELIDVKEYGTTHPDWFPLIDGKRFVPPLNDYGHDWQPCMSNPQVTAEIARKIIETFDQYPEQETFSIAVTDGGGFCECDACRQMDGVESQTNPGYSNRYSRRVVLFSNRIAQLVAKKYPDRLLSIYAYHLTMAPPDDIKLESNIIPYLCSCRDGYYDPYFKQRDLANQDGWSAISNQIGLYEYFYGAGMLVPRIYTNMLAQALRYGYEHKARAFISEAYPNWGLDGPKLYCAANLLWDPYQDPSAMLDEYCAKMFGKAAAPMKAYFIKAEQAWTAKSNPPRGYWFSIPWGNAQYVPYTPRVVSQLSKDLDAAAVAATDEPSKQRVAFIAKSFGLAKILLPYAELLQLAESGAPLKDALPVLKNATGSAVREQIIAYIKVNHQMEDNALYGTTLAEISGHYGVSDGALSGLDHSANRTKVMATYGLITAKAALTTIAAQPPMSPLQFRTKYTDLVNANLEAQLQGVPMSAEHRKIHDEVYFWSLKSIPANKTTAPVIDGKLQDACWATAVRGRNFRLYTTGAETETRTDFAFSYDKDNLYFASWCYQDWKEVDAVPSSTQNGAPVFNDNYVELFLNPDKDTVGTYQLAFSKGGGYVAQGSDNVRWQPAGMKCATAQEDDRWTLEVAIPWKALGWNPVQMRLLRTNVVRNRIIPQPNNSSSHESSTWYLSMDGHITSSNRGYLWLTGTDSTAAAAPSTVNAVANGDFEVVHNVDKANDGYYKALISRGVTFPADPLLLPDQWYMNAGDGWDGGNGFAELITGTPGEEVYSGKYALHINMPKWSACYTDGLPVMREGAGMDMREGILGIPIRFSFYAKGNGAIRVYSYPYTTISTILYGTFDVTPTVFTVTGQWQKYEGTLTFNSPNVVRCSMVVSFSGDVTVDQFIVHAQ
jgi:hypothetical protein